MSRPEYVTVQNDGGFISYPNFPLATWTDAHGVGERLMTHAFLMDPFRKIMGRTLTIIDASISEKTQNKAMKDLVRSVFNDEIGFAAEICFDQTKLQALGPETIEELPEPVTTEQVLGVQ